MLLRSVRVQNFRGVRSARLSLDATTVLIGENDCGRTSVLEAVALALGWDSNECEFQFRPFHLHRPIQDRQSAPPSISIALEFCETTADEWNGAGFEPLRSSLPDALGGERRFRLVVTHGGAPPITSWTFRSARGQPLVNDRELLVWLRRRMPVFWMTEGMVATKPAGMGRATSTEENLQHLADQVSHDYRDLLEGTAPDISEAIERGSAAAGRLLQARAKLQAGRATPLGEVLEEITREPRSARVRSPFEPLRDFGTSAHKIGILLLAGALLRSGVAGVQRGLDVLTLIENPENAPAPHDAGVHLERDRSDWRIEDHRDAFRHAAGRGL